MIASGKFNSCGGGQEECTSTKKFTSVSGVTREENVILRNHQLYLPTLVIQIKCSPRINHPCPVSALRTWGQNLGTRGNMGYVISGQGLNIRGQGVTYPGKGTKGVIPKSTPDKTRLSSFSMYGIY